MPAEVAHPNEIRAERAESLPKPVWVDSNSTKVTISSTIKKVLTKMLVRLILFTFLINVVGNAQVNCSIN